MTAERPLDPGFLERQKRRLEVLREQLRQLERSAASDARNAQSSLGNEPRDTGDEAANFARGEIDQGVMSANSTRLREIERALEKIRDGTYGLSDYSGEPIPLARLEAVPEAIRLAEEE